jgi:methylmalonyl-CoA mutase
MRQEHAHPDVKVTNQAILDDLQGGVTSLLLRLDAAARNGLDPDVAAAEPLAGHDGIMAYHREDFDAILNNVHLRMIGVTLDAGAAFLPAAAALVALWRRRDITSDEARGAFNADPLAVLARHGQLPVSTPTALQHLSAIARWTAENYPHVTAVGVNTAVYHDAGATAAQDIAFGMASAVEYLRAMADAGLDTDQAARQILFRIGLGTHHFLAIAKLRAARRLWARVVQVCGGKPASGAMQIHASTSHRILTQRDPYVNLLRNTVGVFSAGVGGAQSITSVPFDAMTGLPDDFSRRIARNTALILQEEAQLHRVIDPAGGGWYFESLTNEVAKKAWSIFQEIERQGGMVHAIQSGWVAEQIDSAFAPRAKDIARRKEGITGISEFPDIHEQKIVQPAPATAALRSAAAQRIAGLRRESKPLAELAAATADPMAVSVESAASGASLGQLAHALGFHAQPPETIPPLEPRSFAEPFEELRDASDAWRSAHGERPRVFLANMGSVSHHTARATFAKNFFEAGGLEVASNDGFPDAAAATTAFDESGANIAVICSSDKLYPDIVPQLAPNLKAAGARTVVLAGNPGANEDAWRAAGVDRFIFIGCDVLTTLREMLREEGVLS